MSEMMSPEVGQPAVQTPQPPIAVNFDESVNNIPENQSEESTNTEVADQDQRPAKIFTQEELDKVVAKRLSKAERSWERKHRELLETALNAQNKQPQQEPRGESSLVEPDPMNFDDYSDYMRAMARYEAAVTIQNTVRQAEQQRTAKTQQERQLALVANMQRQVALASEKYDDFDEVVRNPDLSINDSMVELIAESDVGGELAYYLGKNPEEAAKVAALSPLQAAKAIARIEDKINQTIAAAKESSKAPPPIDPVKSRATAEKDPSQMTDAEFDAWRKKQIAARGRR